MPELTISEDRPQPNSKHCFVCGLENEAGLKARFTDNGVDEVHATYIISPQHQGYPGVAHGAIIAGLLDEVAGRVMMIGHPHRFFMTGRLEIRFRKPVPIGVPLTLTGRALADRGRTARVKGTICLPDGSVAAEAEALMVDYPIEFGQVELETLGWRVYPDDDRA